MKCSADNMNNAISEKYGISPKNIQTKPLPSEQFRKKLNFDRIKRSKKNC